MVLVWTCPHHGCWKICLSHICVGKIMSLPFIWEGLKLLVWSMVSSVSLLLFAMCSNEGSLVHWYLFKPLCIFTCLNRWHELLITRGSFQHFWPRAFSFVIVFEWGESLTMRRTVRHCVSSTSWSSSSSSTGYFNIYLSFFLLKGFNRYSLDWQDFQNCPVFLLKSKRLPSLQLCLFFQVWSLLRGIHYFQYLCEEQWMCIGNSAPHISSCLVLTSCCSPVCHLLLCL